jgi:hypothetical protein
MPVRVCLNAAQEVCAILSEYVDDLGRLPCDIIFPIVLTAATLWQHRGEFGSGPDRAKAQQQIDLCVKCLSIVGKFWKNAGDCRRRLIRGERRLCSNISPRRLLTDVMMIRFRGRCLDAYTNDQ